MTMSLTFLHADPGCSRAGHGAATLLAAALIAIAAPAAACEKAVPTPIANAAAQTRAPGGFTGEFVNGAPVYRLPSITVVGRREAEVAKAQREAKRSRSG